MKVTCAFHHLAVKTSRIVREAKGPSGWKGDGALGQHRRIGLILSAALTLLSIRCLFVSDVLGAFFLSLTACTSAVLTTTCWYLDRREAVRVLGNSKSAQECADLILNELREEGISFDEEQLAESVATVLLQQRLDLAGFVDATVEHANDGVYHVIGSAESRTGERVEFMSKLCLWWSGGGRVHCDSLGLIWR